MLLRNSTLVGGSPGALPPPAAAAFARGAAAVLARWTALRLAVEGEWGGPDSGAKADRLLADVVAWFGRGQGKERGGLGGMRLQPPTAGCLAPLRLKLYSAAWMARGRIHAAMPGYNRR